MTERAGHEQRARNRTGAIGTIVGLAAALTMAAAGPASAGSRPLFVPIGPAGSSVIPTKPHTPALPGSSTEPGANGRIAFVSDRYAATPNVYTVDPTNSTSVARLTGCNGTHCPGGAVSPAWSPEGLQIAFVRGSDGSGLGPIYEMFSGGSNQHQVGSLIGESPTWSPDGTKLAYASPDSGPNEGIFVANADGTGSPTNITNDPTVAHLQPAWSPDGSKIAYTAIGQAGAFDIFVIASDGSGSPVNITHSDTPEQRPAWSPDGTMIAYDDGTGISWIHSDGTGNATLVAADGIMPSWSADGTLLAFSTARDGNPEIYTTTLDGLTQTRITSDPGADILPAWQSIQITLATSASIVHFKDNVTLTVHLNVFQLTQNLTVSIYKIPFSGQTYLVKTGTVDANGDFAVTTPVYDRTSFYATWDGDGTLPPSRSQQRVVQVQSVTTGVLSGYYGISGDYKLYHYTTQCVGSQHLGCPVYTVTVVPDGTGLPVDFTFQELSGSTWSTIVQFTFVLPKGSRIAVKLTYSNNGVIGHSFRIMASFTGNGKTLSSASDWAYFKITT